nr:hypothetical protein [Gemmatimonadales bacterium]
MTFAARLVVGTVLVLILAISVLLWTAERSLRQDLEGDIALSLEGEARLVGAALPADSAEWGEAVQRLAQQNSRRITVVDRSGRVVADSDFPEGPPPASADSARRGEIRAALRGRIGIAKRNSETVGRQLMYVAVPGGPGAVRVATGLTQVDEVVQRALGAVAGAALLALLVGAVFAFIAGRSIAQPLTTITAAARAIAAGSPP